MTEGAGSRAWWLAGGAFVVVLALLIIALVREPVELDPNTPEGAVQNYLQALSDGDYAGAFNLIDPEWTEGCTPADLAAAAPNESFTATLGETETTDDIAFITVSIRQGADPGPFDAGIRTFSEFFELEKQDGQWLLTGHPWPYFEWRCEGP